MHPLQRFVDETIAQGLTLTEARRRLVAELECVYVASLLARHDGSVSRAAAASGLAGRYFRVLKARYQRRSASECTSTAHPRR